MDRDSRKAYEVGGKYFNTGLDLTLAFIGGKWKPLILWCLRDGKKRFKGLKANIPAITEKMLSTQLKALEKDDLIVRRAYAEVPPRVEYELSSEGENLIPVLKAMAAWGHYKGHQGKVIEQTG